MDGFKDLFGRVSNVVVETGKTVGSVVADKAKEAKDLAKDTVEIASIKNQITASKEIIRSSYEALGKYYYDKYNGGILDGDEEPEVVVNSIRAIDNANKLIAEYEAKIEEIKTTQAECKAARDAAAEGAEDIVVEATDATETVDDELAAVKESTDDDSSDDTTEE